MLAEQVQRQSDGSWDCCAQSRHHMPPSHPKNIQFNSKHRSKLTELTYRLSCSCWGTQDDCPVQYSKETAIVCQSV